jgi:hypothetical protein
MADTPEFLIFNIKSDTKSFLLVRGRHNFDIAKGFEQPCVALLHGWSPEYHAQLPPAAERIEVTISLVDSGEYEANLVFLRSIARDSWLRSKCVVSNIGIASLAEQRRQYGADNALNYSARQFYLQKHFTKFPATDAALVDFCQPHHHDVTLVSMDSFPPKPAFRDQATFDAASPQEKAAAIAGWESWWRTRSTPSAGAQSAGPRIVVPTINREESNDWKGRLTEGERAALDSDDWKRF